MFVIFVIVFYKPLNRLIGGIKQIDGKNKSISFNQPVKKEDGNDDIMMELDSTFSISFLNETKDAIFKEYQLGKKPLQEQIDFLSKACAALAIANNFNSTYVYCIGSHIRLLQALNSSDGVSLQEIKDFYHEVEKQYPELQQQYSFESFLALLLNHNLIATQEDKYHITVGGQNFLTYLIKEALPMDKDY